MSQWDEWIGRSTTCVSSMDPQQSVRMQATLDRPATLSEGSQLPPAWHWLYFFDAYRTSELGRDGHTRLGISLPEFPLPRRMWAGGKIAWHKPVMLGQQAVRETTISKIEEKQGRTGSLIFVTIQHVVSQKNEVCISEEQNIVYREAATSSITVAPEQAPHESEFQQPWKFTSTELFRYSALTFNAHKIHYDSDYAREIEGYSNVVVHGPLLATLMLDLALVNERPLNSFSYRARSPICLPAGLVTHAQSDGSSTNLWVASDSGALAMQGSLT